MNSLRTSAASNPGLPNPETLPSTTESHARCLPRTPPNDATQQAAIDHYHEEIDGLLAAGITPMVTLLHFTHPLWFEDKGGFESDDSPATFVTFARRMYQEYGGKVGMLNTVAFSVFWSATGAMCCEAQ